ncbi:unnamed protein product [Cylicocyclus nassatus]|uniref:RING-type domain-containing protein n=1 Tax=Cylicocyclus nassatus TaxID=53992 RepID=A0AA36GUH9_CYLNA|nr:unnamed protein product [Cylicocyclus nassatus]
MIDESDSSQPRTDNTPSTATRRVEILGSSENPIVLGESPVESRTTTEHSRGRAGGTTRPTSRRKCPLGAYVEIIDESRPSRVVPSISNRVLPSTNAATVPPINLRGEPVGSTSLSAPVTQTVQDNGNAATSESDPPPTSAQVESGFLKVPKDFEILMRCSICMEIFHNPANVAPCNHKFCLSCLWTWKRANQMAVCPQCRGPILSWQKDAQFNEVVESFLSANPSKQRSASELEALDAMQAECWSGAVRGRGSSQPRSRASRDRTIRSPFLIRVSQIRAHRSPLSTRQRGNRRGMEWSDLG